MTSHGRETRASKRQKLLTDDLICPITRELPFDPVMAKDGRIYERLAIEKHFETSIGRPLKSPITNEPLQSKDLIPSFQTKNHIKSLIEAGVVTGELLDSWKKKESEKRFKDELLKKAENGDAACAYAVYRCLIDGTPGFGKDPKLAFQWLQKAHWEGNVNATPRLGRVYLRGHLQVGDCVFVVGKNITYGVMLLTEAACKGSNFAKYKLGRYFARGQHGLPKDKAQSKRWLLKSLDDEGSHDLLDADRLRRAHLELGALGDSDEEED